MKSVSGRARSDFKLICATTLVQCLIWPSGGPQNKGNGVKQAIGN